MTLRSEHAGVERVDPNGAPIGVPLELREPARDELFKSRDKGLLGSRTRTHVRRNKIIKPD